MSNRHPVDKLGDVRAEIKRLQEEEAWLRNELEHLVACSGPDSLKGDEFEARLDRKSSARLDRKLVEAKFGRKALDGCFKSSEFTTVTLWRKINKPEIYTSLQQDIQDEVPF